MKAKILISAIVLGCVLSCTTKELDEFNKPYNAVTDPNFLLLINSSIGLLNGDQFGYWIHHRTRPNTTNDLYDDFNETNPWNGVYKQNKNLLDALQKTSEFADPSQENAHALALILRSSLFIRLTDSYGDVPYAEAGYEDENGIIETPVYDSQESIYRDCFANLTKAIDLIGESELILLGEADYIYHEDLQKWILFANTIRLRMALRVTGVDASLANQWFAEVAKHPVINSNEESATYERFDIEGFRNPLWHSTPNISRMSKLFVDYLKDNNDPRLTKFVSPNNIGEYVGLVNGLDYTSNTNEFSDIGAELAIADRAAPILLYDEVCYIKAEMYLRGLGVTADVIEANSWYQNGIRANMEYYNVPTTEIDAFITTEAEATLNGDESNKRRQIGSQKWIGGIYNGYELFADMKRSGYPVIADRTSVDDPAVSLGETNGKMPRRLKYPDDEMHYNTGNYNSAKIATDDNSFLHRMWWDVN